MKTVILVPRRNDNGHRDALWAWCKAWWQRNVGLPIVEGHHDTGLFNRSAAVNTAARGRWDVAILIDSDVICDAGRVREAIILARATGRVVLPFTARYNLSRHGTVKVMDGEAGTWKGYVARTYHDMVSSCVVIPRSAWDAVGGFDESFRGWGFEDTAWAAAVETLTERRLLYIRGELWHLFHPAAPEGRRHSPTFKANQARAKLYEDAWGQPEAMRALLGQALEVAA